MKPLQGLFSIFGQEMGIRNDDRQRTLLLLDETLPTERWNCMKSLKESYLDASFVDIKKHAEDNIELLGQYGLTSFMFVLAYVK